MTGTSLSWPWKMLLVLLLASSCVHDLRCLEIVYKLLMNGNNVFLTNGAQATFKSFKSKSKMECASSCMNEEFCHVWRFDNGNCHMFHSLLDKVTVNYTTDPNQLTYYELKEGKVHCRHLLCFIFFVSFLFDLFLFLNRIFIMIMMAIKSIFYIILFSSAYSITELFIDNNIVFLVKIIFSFRHFNFFIVFIFIL